ncbi:phycobiliprotein lyase [Pleurocapsa sp. PCC 7319]|uniref:phycobiliprotein lyase n=1 Tax=Pleurocapsa sp. PCC 7319 TaxID=118161 RepID=UPI0003649448|nr:phycobiliprotein lyase [Pleurocapsa sp. PCC 7319]
MNDSVFQQFLVDCIGEWVSERTYHYLDYQKIERSRTNFIVKPLTSPQKTQVLTKNAYELRGSLEEFRGFNLGFYTINDRGEEVINNLNLMCIPTTDSGNLLEGDYLRDFAYEEARPIIAHFCFNALTKELLMTTNYTRVVSVDSITMSNPHLRIRRILNYQRPPEGQPLENILLVGFGVEQKKLPED